MKIIYYFISLLLIIYPLKSCFANYIKYSTSSLISNGQGQWDSSQINHPFVLYDNGFFKMWYSGHNGSHFSIGYATSIDGISWIRYPNNPVISWKEGDPKPYGFAEPFVLKFNDSDYRMWFTSQKTPENKDLIGYATSTDGVKWTVQNYKVFEPTQSWDTYGLAYPTVIYENGTFKMWYSGLSDAWRIGYATSDNGINWTPYASNPVLQKSNDNTYEYDQFGEFKVYKLHDRYIGFYNTNVFNTPWSNRICFTSSIDGISWTKDDSINPVISVDRPNAFDSIEIDGASYLKLGNTSFLWYSGRGNTPYQIGLAYEGDRPIPATPSATPTIDLTPTPTPLEPIVVIPGIMSSWNSRAILHNKTVSPSDWKLLSFVKEYDGISQTLKKLGYTENDTFYLWPYDWRKPVSSIASDLDAYLNDHVFSKYPDRKIHLIGHSLGGIVARGWAQEDSHKEKIHEILTLGSPNLGTIQSYMLWEGATVPFDSYLLSLAGKIFVQLYGNLFDSPIQNVRSLFPVLKDMLPTESYLRSDSDNKVIPISGMTESNAWLTDRNNSVSSLFPMLTTFYGTGGSSPNFYRVIKPNWFEEKLGMWKDGKVIKTETSDGDSVVPTLRAYFSAGPSASISASHGNLIASPESIRTILSTLSIPFTNSDIFAGKETQMRPSLLFLLRSPATMTVLHDGNTYTDEDGIIFIPEAKNGQYSVSVKGTENGTYTLSIGQFGTSTDSWKDLTSSIKSSETQKFTFNFSQSSPSPNPFINQNINDLFSDIETNINALKPLVSYKVLISKTLLDLKRLKQAHQRNQTLLAKGYLELLLTDISVIRRTKKSIRLYQETLPIDEALIDLADRLFTVNKQQMFKPLMKVLDKGTVSLLNQAEKSIKRKRLSEFEQKYYSLIYLEAENVYQQSRNDVSDVRKFFTLSHAHILLTELP